MLQDVQMQCGACGTPLVVKIAPSVVQNLEFVSMVVIEHSGQAQCSKCGNVVNPALTGLQGVAMVAIPVPPERQNKLVVPAAPNGKVTLT